MVLEMTASAAAMHQGAVAGRAAGRGGPVDCRRTCKLSGSSGCRDWLRCCCSRQRNRFKVVQDCNSAPGPSGLHRRIRAAVRAFYPEQHLACCALPSREACGSRPSFPSMHGSEASVCQVPCYLLRPAGLCGLRFATPVPSGFHVCLALAASRARQHLREVYG